MAPRSVSVENMMIGVRRPSARMAATVAMPSISGISMSIVIRSGRSWSSLARATLPLTAVPTTSMAGSPASTSVTILRTTIESSTTITRIGGTESCSLLGPPGGSQWGGCRHRAGRA